MVILNKIFDEDVKPFSVTITQKYKNQEGANTFSGHIVYLLEMPDFHAHVSFVLKILTKCVLMVRTLIFFYVFAKCNI